MMTSITMTRHSYRAIDQPQQGNTAGKAAWWLWVYLRMVLMVSHECPPQQIHCTLGSTNVQANESSSVAVNSRLLAGFPGCWERAITAGLNHWQAHTSDMVGWATLLEQYVNRLLIQKKVDLTADLERRNLCIA